MSLSALKDEEITSVTGDSDFDLQRWLKEIEGAENLMKEVENKADKLQEKVDALLLEVEHLPKTTENRDIVMNETGIAEKEKKQEEKEVEENQEEQTKQ